MNKKDFTRNRKLPFSKMILTMMQKSLKSLQSVLNETQIKISQLLGDDLKTISSSAYSQARDKLNFTAFVELSSDICSIFYKDDDYDKYKNFRVLAVDGSMVTLPNTLDVQQEFNTTKVVNQYKHKEKQIVQARVSVLYDVLNNISLDSVISNSNIGETTLAKNHLKYTNKDDLIIFDRGYPSYSLFVNITNKYNANFVVRMKRNIYKEVSFLYDKDSTIKDTIITIKPSTKKLSQEIQEEHLPCELKIRFVQVVLDDGEVEVLATSVLDDNIISTNEFKELYFKRWGIETFYGILKNRLSLENFTGHSALAVKQDFYATIFISNLESIMTSNIDEELSHTSIKNNNKYQQKVNKSISYNIIKNYCFELFYSNEDIDIIFEKMYKLFQTTKVPIRPNRHYKRPTSRDGKNTKGIKSANFQKRSKKVVF